MRSALYTLLTAIGIMCALPADRAEALEVFGNNAPANTGPNLKVTSGFGVYGPSLAQGFRTGSVDYEIQSVQMVMNFQQTNPTSYFSLGLYGSEKPGSLEQPGTFIGNFDINSTTYTANADTLYTFNFGSSFTLAKDTNYWVVVSNSSSTISFNWLYYSAAPVGENNSGYAPITGGSTVGKPVASPTTWTASPGNAALSFRVIVVPEPSTYALGIVGTLVMGTVARRKSRKPAKA